MLNYR